MAEVAAIATIIGGVAAVGSAIVQNKRTKEAAAEQRRQNNVRNRIERQAATRRALARVAQSRVQRAETQAAGFTFGVSGSTSVAQTVGAGQSDLAGAVGFQGSQSNANTFIANSQNRISEIQSQFDPFGAIAGLSSGFTNAQNNRAIAGVFGG